MTKSDAQIVLDALQHYAFIDAGVVKLLAGFKANADMIDDCSIAQQALPAAQRLVDASGWQPAETAPRNGTEIDVWSGSYRVCKVIWYEPQQQFVEMPFTHEVVFTHWRLPPNPPTTREE